MIMQIAAVTFAPANSGCHHGRTANRKAVLKKKNKPVISDAVILNEFFCWISMAFGLLMLMATAEIKQIK